MGVEPPPIANGHLPDGQTAEEHLPNGHMLGDENESLLNLSNAIQRRVSVEKSLKETVSISAQPTSLIDRIAQVDQLVDYFVEASSKNQASSANGVDQNGHTNGGSGQENGIKNNRHNDQKENISLNGNVSDSLGGSEASRKKYEEEIAEMKAKYLKHRQILVSNREMAEREVLRLDDIYHETVSEVLETLSSIPEVVKSNRELSSLQGRLQTALLNAQESTDTNVTPGTQPNGKIKINGILNATAAAATSEQGL